MPRPSKQWEKKYGKQQQQRKEHHRLTANDDVLSAVAKLRGTTPEAQAILLQMLRTLLEPEWVIRLLDADDIQLYGRRIVEAYHRWAGNSYAKLADGLRDRDQTLVAFVNSVEE